MASKYTSVVYIQGNSRRRYRGYVSATVTNVSATQSRVDWYASVEMYNAAQYGVAVTCTVDGTQRGSDEGYLSSSPGTTYKTVASTSGSTTFSRGSSARSVSVSVRAYGKTVSGYGSAGGSATASVSVTIPSIAYSKPAAPSGCAASRVSDTQAKVTWANGSTSTTTPRSATLVERQTDEGAWSQVEPVGASVTNYTDNSVSPNHRYAYRVRASGAGGTSGYSTSGYVYTTPAAPASVSVAVVTGTTCSVDVDGSNAPWATSWEVQSQLNGGDWVAVGTYSTFPQTVDLGGGTVKVRARALRGTLASAWAESAAVTTITPPLAPTVSLSPSGVAPTGSVVGVSWVPNHPDGSAQTQAQVEYAVGDGDPVTADVTGTATTYQLPEAATASATTVSVRVRTHGADEEWGAWSQPLTLAVAVPPSVYFSVPPVDGAAVGTLPLTVEWDVVDSTGVASQSVALLDASGRTLYSAEPAPSARELVLGDSTYRLSNTTEYTLRITVRGGSSLTATAERSFRTIFAEPAHPVAQAETDHSDMSVAVTVHAGSPSSDAGEVIEVPATPGTLVPGLTVYGATRQNLWVNPSGTNKGVTLTVNDDGSVTLSGTSTGPVNVFKSMIYSLRIGSTYTLSIDSLVTGILPNDFGFMVQSYNGTDFTNVALVGATALSNTFTVPSDSTIVAFTFTCATGNTVSGTYRIMLNEGDEPEPWCPPGLNSVDELSIVTAGKNLTGAAEFDADWASITPVGTNKTMVEALNLLVAGTYTLSADFELTETDSDFDGATSSYGFVFGRAFDDCLLIDNTARKWGADAKVGDVKHYEKQFEVTEDYVGHFGVFYAYGCGIGSTGATGKAHISSVQIELGSTATDYEPPAVTTTPIDLDGHALNGLPDGTRDELRIDGTGAVTLVQRVGVAIAPTAAGSWSYEDGMTRAFFALPSAGPASEGDETEWLLCDKLPVRDGTPAGNSSYALVAASTAYAKNPAITSAAAAATVAGGATYLYPLATPQEVELPGISMPSFPADPSTLFAASDVPCAVQVDYPATSSLTVQRVAPDGSRWTVADGLLSGQQAIDPLPPLNVPYTYEVTASTEAGSAYTLDVPHEVETVMAAFNFGAAAAVAELARLDPSWSHDVARSGTLYHFADGGEGGGLPVAYGGQDVDATRSMGFALLDTEQLRRLQALAREYYVCWYRDPYGGRALCSVSWSFSSGIPYDLLKVSASMTETVFEEAW